MATIVILLGNHLPLSEQPTAIYTFNMSNYHVDNLAYNGVGRVPEGACISMWFVQGAGGYAIISIRKIIYCTCTVYSYKRVNMMSPRGGCIFGEFHGERVSQIIILECYNNCIIRPCNPRQPAESAKTIHA